MAAQKKIIKADAVEMMGAKVEKMDFDGRKFGNKIFKDAQVSEEPVELEKTELPDEEEQVKGDEEKKEVELEKSYDDDGNLTGLVIRCKCGEVIELEFTRD